MRALVAVMLLTSGIARADSNDLVGRALVLGRGELEAHLTVAMNLRSGRFAEPASISPDVWFGVTPKLTVGLVHSARSVDEIAADRPVCVNGCDADYAGGIDVRYGVHRLVTPRARVLLRDVDPVKPAITLGALARWTRGRFAIASDPYVRLGLANRERGNRAALVVPVFLAVQPTCKWMLGVRAGYDSSLAVARDGWRGPVGWFAGVHPIEPLEVVVEYAYRSLIGPQHEYRERILMITVGWHQRIR